MTESNFPDFDEAFEPDASIEAAGLSADTESTNVCRVAALAMLLNRADGQADQLREPLRQLGFSEFAIRMLGEDTRRQVDFYDWFGPLGAELTDDRRTNLWALLNETADSTSAGGFLMAVLGSHLERESAAAAAAMVRFLPEDVRYAWRLGPVPPPYWEFWPEIGSLFDEFPWLRIRPGLADELDEDEPEMEWNADGWNEVYEAVSFRFRRRRATPYLVGLLVRARLRLAARSPDPITRSLALATRMNQSIGITDPEPNVASSSTPPGALVVSTMIHGTFGWKGDWWRPSGAFHKHVLHNHRPNLYSRGARFSWSGAYSASQRRIAADDLVDWAADVAPNGMQTVFAHSYGADVAAIAALGGSTMHELVLLSAPGTRFVNQAVGLGMRVADIRLPFDPVLAIAGTPQRLSPAYNVIHVPLKWSLDHGATHSERVWVEQSIAARAGI